MSNPSRIGVSSRILAAFFILMAGNACRAQQTYVSRYAIYTGFSDLNTPALNSLNQVGFHLQAGVNNRSWLSSGFDYSVQTGATVLTTNLATPALQQQLAALPPGYHLALPIDVNTQTFTIGSQYEYRHFAKTTLFLRPALSAFRIKSVPHPADPIAALVSSEIAPQGEKTDWVGAYGVGGGAEFAASKHLGIRMQLDAVYNHPYNDILGNGNWTYRYSVGPAFHFGRNILDQQSQK